MKSSIVHTCFSQNLNETKPARCRCRKRITLTEATKAVEKGFAQWLILSQTLITGKELCSMCLGEKVKRNCQHCKGTGEIEKSYPLITHGSDIVLVTAGTPNESGDLVYKSAKAKKTPRVATIEKAHIERAYVDGRQDEQERIELYGLMTLQARIEMGIKPEPPDDPKTGTGRNYDYGRSPFAKIADERTSVGAVGSRIVGGFYIMDEMNDRKDWE